MNKINKIYVCFESPDHVNKVKIQFENSAFYLRKLMKKLFQNANNFTHNTVITYFNC